MGEALGWVRDNGLTAGDILSYLHEYEHITLARVLIAQGGLGIATAITLLERLLHAAQDGERTGSVIEILVLQACALEAQGDLADALVPLNRALALAEPEGYIRIFLDEGLPMARLLTEANVRSIMPAYTGQLLAASGSTPSDSATLVTSRQMESTLSRRELEVVGLISQGFSNKEISEALFLAIDTVKGHNRTLFRKLGSQNRTEAVARARKIGLV